MEKTMRVVFDIARRCLAAVVAASIVWNLSWPALADAIQAQGAAGQSFGTAITPSAPPTVNLSPTDLYPQSEANKLGSSGDVNSAKSLYGNDTGMTQAGTSMNSLFRGQENDPHPAETVNAYQTLRGSYSRVRPDLRSDPIWHQTDDVNANLSTIFKSFSDCSTNTSFSSGTNTVHIPDIKTCDKVIDPMMQCTINRDYVVGVLKQVSGPLGVQSCGPGCIEMYVGRVGDDYYPGNCTIFEENTVVDVFNPEAITDAKLVYGKWDDYMQVWLNGDKVWQSASQFPPETDGECELSTSWERDLDVDVTSQMKAGGTVDFKIRTSVSGNGEGYAKIRIHYNSNVLVSDSWSPPECVKVLQSITDGYCTGTATCDNDPQLDANGCGIIDGVPVCENMFPPAPVSGLSPVCKKATVKTACSYWKGQMDCYTDANGNQQCPTNDGDANTCAEYESNPSCGFQSSKCVQYATGASGTCYVTEETWDCGTNANVPTTNKNTSYQCAGQVRCMGTDCLSVNNETSADFAKAVAGLQAANMMGMDGECDTNTNTCTVFKGKAGECKRAVGGIVNCCKGATTVSISDYLTLAMAVGKLDTALTKLDAMPAVQGAWETLRQPFADAWSEVSKPFTSAWEGIWGGTEEVAGKAASEGVISTVTQTITNQVGQWTADIFGDAAANSLFSVASTGGDAFVSGAMQGPLQLGGGAAIVGSVLSWVMTAYTIYQIVMILIKLIWKCEKDEFELQVKRDLKSCHYVGSYCKSKFLGMCIERRESYCCFNSPLSRIIQEQARNQINKPWGDPDSPNCEGLSVADIGAVDWSKVDLSEWMGLLSMSGQLPTMDNTTLQNLTGTGSVLQKATTTPREDTAQRTVDRIKGIDTTGDRLKATQELFSQTR